LSSQDARDADTSDERTLISGPRLRRGGIRAPESMLSRHASPLVILPSTDSPPLSPSREASDHSNSLDAGGYPTPGSTDNENAS
jgi:hypothetical protein